MMRHTWLNFRVRGRPQIKTMRWQNGFRAAISNIFSDPMELAGLKNPFTSFITGSGVFGNVNALANRGNISPLAWWGYYGAQAPKL